MGGKLVVDGLCVFGLRNQMISAWRVVITGWTVDASRSQVDNVKSYNWWNLQTLNSLLSVPLALVVLPRSTWRHPRSKSHLCDECSPFLQYFQNGSTASFKSTSEREISALQNRRSPFYDVPCDLRHFLLLPLHNERTPAWVSPTSTASLHDVITAWWREWASDTLRHRGIVSAFFYSSSRSCIIYPSSFQTSSFIIKGYKIGCKESRLFCFPPRVKVHKCFLAAAKLRGQSTFLRNCGNLHLLHIKNKVRTRCYGPLLSCTFPIYLEFNVKNQRGLRGIITT